MGGLRVSGGLYSFQWGRRDDQSSPREQVNFIVTKSKTSHPLSPSVPSINNDQSLTMLSPVFLQECVFTKQSNLSFLHVIFEGSIRVGFCNSCCKRWFFAFNDLECENANIEARLQGTKEFAGMEYRHVRLEGYCAVPAGEVLVELWVQDCFGHQRTSKVSFVKVDLSPRVTVEEISLSDV